MGERADYDKQAGQKIYAWNLSNQRLVNVRRSIYESGADASPVGTQGQFEWVDSPRTPCSATRAHDLARYRSKIVVSGFAMAGVFLDQIDSHAMLGAAMYYLSSMVGGNNN